MSLKRRRLRALTHFTAFHIRPSMKALIKSAAEPGLRLQEAPRPSIGINDVLIQTTGICGTDVHIYNWDAWARKTIPWPDGRPRIRRPHRRSWIECSRLHPGDIVSGEGHVVCGQCRNCLAGRRHLCADTKGVGVNRPGAFAEYIALPMHESAGATAHHTIPRDVAAIFDPFGNAVHTALSFDVLGEDVLITGAGPIGVMAAAVVRHAGRRYVVVTDVNPYRLELAKKMGARWPSIVRSESTGRMLKRNWE